MIRCDPKIYAYKKNDAVTNVPEQISPMISVIINNFSSMEKLERCLSSVFRTNYPVFEVIIVDCLTTNIENWVELHYSDAKVIHLDCDVGPCSQFNFGFKLSCHYAVL